MLTWRALSRTATTLRLGTPRRHIHVSVPRYQQLRPSGLWGRLRYRDDGKPRSRLVGAGYGKSHDFEPVTLTEGYLVTLLVVNGLTLLTMYDLVEDSEVALGLLASIIYIQQVDMGFDKVNFDEPIPTLIYFKTLYQAFSRIPPNEVDELFTDLTRLIKSGGANNAEGEAHRIMRNAAEQIHYAFQDLNQESISNTANFVLLVIKDALEGLIELVQDSEDDDSDSKYTFQLIRDHSKKDPGSVLKDYESLG